jgi:hypothetical protein
LSPSLSATPRGYFTYAAGDIVLVTAAVHNASLDPQIGIYEMSVTSGVEVFLSAGYLYALGMDTPPLLGASTYFHAYADTNNAGIFVQNLNSVPGIIFPYAPGFFPVYPCVSYDFYLLAYVSMDSGAAGEDSLVVHPRYGNTGVFTVVTTTGGKNMDIEHPRFTPDRRECMFILYDHMTGTRTIYRIPVKAGQTLAQATAVPVPQSNPRQLAISPDGNHIAYVAETGGTTQLFIAARSGSGSRQVTYPAERAACPSFSPDNLYIAVGSYDGIIIIDLSSDTIIRRIPTSETVFHSLSWHLGASQEGMVMKSKNSDKKLKFSTASASPDTLPDQGIVVYGSEMYLLDESAFWTDKKGKKYQYKDKKLKWKVSFKVKNNKGKVSLRKPIIFPGTTVVSTNQVPIAINAGDMTLVEIITPDTKGKYKYKAPKN